MILERGLTGRVQMLGTVSRETLVLVPLGRRRGRPLAPRSIRLDVAEAAGAGATVVASDIGAHRDVARLLPEDQYHPHPPNVLTQRTSPAPSKRLHPGAHVGRWCQPYEAGKTPARGQRRVSRGRFRTPLDLSAPSSRGGRAATEASETTLPNPMGLLPVVSLLVAVGLLIIAAAYSSARLDASQADPLFWAGSW